MQLLYLNIIFERMKITLLPLLLSLASVAQAQTTSNASYQIPYKKPDAQLLFGYTDKGKPTPIEWGFDLAWLSEDNVRRGIAFSGKEVVDIMRLSFQPTHSVESGKFSADQQKNLDKRISIVKKYCKADITYNMNCDHASLDEWYNDECTTSAERAEHWVKLFDMTADYYKSKGLTRLVSISPLNEPDYEWHALPTFKHRKADFLEMCKLMKTNEAYKEKYADVRLCGGNTLNDDKAYEWWNYLKAYLDEGNTHQLAGSFDNYASFYQKLVSAGHHATNDELHNTMEAMVGVEYGMQTAIWWGTAERARAQLMKATYQGNPGDRLAYGEHRKNWTSATVYRQTDGSVQGFIGSSERQATTTNYEFVSVDRDVFYNGQGPMRHFVMEIPGGTGYQTGQTNAEVVFDIQSGEDVQPYINGTYRIVSKYCNRSGKGKYLGFATDPGSSWKQLQQTIKPAKEANNGFTQWTVKPVDNRIGGDYSYYEIRMAGNDKILMDILNWSLDNGGQVGSFPGGFGSNEQWYLQYAGDGWFYIRSRHSNLALSCNSTSTGTGNVTQATFKEGDDKLMWRFIDANAEYDREAPAIPTELKATAQPASVVLTWKAVEDEDIKGYDILRTEKGAEDWNTIGRDITGTSFVDNSAEDGKLYMYAVRSTDGALNRSEKSEAIEAGSTGEKALVCEIDFEEDLYDKTPNANHAVATADELKFSDKDTNKKHGETSVDLSAGNTFVQLPSTIGHHDNMTICCWVRRYDTRGTWERIFDFGNGEDQYMFLTPSNGSKMRFVMKNKGEEQALDCSPLTTGLKHIAVTISGDNGTAQIYVNGELKASKENFTIKPSDINGVCNYIGRSQFINDPLLKGFVDDFRVYNYVLSSEEIADIYNLTEKEEDAIMQTNSDKVQTAEYDLNGRPASNKKNIRISKGRKFIVR